mmetsp:Transcript_16966/g.42574  ORF Transcript_16966/g.42574 Transcript_16966/m.42574 type:complete len:401 (+) Transcript_16966:110-1312(+)
MLHALFFSSDLMPLYIDANGDALGVDAVLATSQDGTHKLLKTPKVLSEASKLYGCESGIAGVPLEDDGGAGTEGSHWEATVVRDDIMLGTTSSLQTRNFGPLSYALMEDSGWYLPKWDTVRRINEASGAGCDFVNERCSEYHAANADAGLFCYARQTQLTCSRDHRSREQCQEEALSSCPTPRAVRIGTGNSHCFDAANSELPTGSDLLFFGSEYGPFSRCVKVGSALEVLRPDSTAYYQPDPVPQCYRMSCTEEGLLQLNIAGETLDCPTGAMLDMADLHPAFRGGTLGPCPDNAELCAALACPEDCSAQGRCVDGRCACDLGWVGADCSLRICTAATQCDAAGEECDVLTGMCGPPRPPFQRPARVESASSRASSAPIRRSHITLAAAVAVLAAVLPM